MSFDVSDLQRLLNRHGDDVVAVLAEGVAEFAEQVLADSQELCPVSPVDPKHPHYIGTSGALRDSGTVGEVVVANGVISIDVGYNAEYAAAVHERLDAEHRYPGAVNPNAQAKFLETAFRNREGQLLPYLTDKVRERFGG